MVYMEYLSRDTMRLAAQNFDEYWSGGDPEIRQRFLMRTIVPMITIVTSYVLFVSVIGPSIMKNRKPLQIRKLIIVYNFALVAFYLYFLARGALFFPELGFSFICGSLNSLPNPIIPTVFTLGYHLYVVRCIELLDTVFLVLTKKFNMITPLHVFHHAIVPVFGWFGFRTETSGYLAIIMGLNCAVHVVMYTYYAIAALGPKYHKYIWWKKYLTSLQILQFLVMSIYLLLLSAMGCTTSKITFGFCIFLTVLFFFLFINFYRQAYKEKSGMNKKVETNGIHKSSGLQNGVPTAYKNALKKES